MERQWSGTGPYDRAVENLSARMQDALRRVPSQWKRCANEVRLRTGRPVAITAGRETVFLLEDGTVCRGRPLPGALVARQEDLEESFRCLCEYSVHSHQNEIRSGFLPLRGGHRAGICGTAVYSGGQLTGLRDISSINLRIARAVEGAADSLLRLLDLRNSSGILLAGPPSSGKTTLLRDLARQLAGGLLEGGPMRVAVVDERGELAGTYRGASQNDLGYCCDILDGYGKADGILQAIRGLSPQVIVCDELGNPEDYESVRSGVNAGVRMVASVHAGNISEVAENRRVRMLLDTGAFSHVAVLRGVGEIGGVYRAEELYDQNHRADSDCSDRNGGRLYGVQKAI